MKSTYNSQASQMNENKILIFLATAIVALITFVAAPVSGQSGSGALKVTSFPSGANVTVDDVDTGKVTPMSLSLTVGDHHVVVSIPNSGWRPDDRHVDIVSGNNDLSVTLLPILTVGPPGPKGDKGDKGEKGDPGASATRADGPCFDNTNRYVDCSNGTVTDTVTGLIWLKHADCLPDADWASANEAATGLKNGDCTLTDNSSPGDWRLPTKAEWDATIARAVALGCRFGNSPSLTNDASTACYGDGTASSVEGVVSDRYWSSSSDEGGINVAWAVDLTNGDVAPQFIKRFPMRVWPVRGGK